MYRYFIKKRSSRDYGRHPQAASQSSYTLINMYSTDGKRLAVASLRTCGEPKNEVRLLSPKLFCTY